MGSSKGFTKAAIRAVALTTATVMTITLVPIGSFAKGWEKPKPKPVTKLAPGLTQTPDAALRKKIAAKEAAAAKRVSDVRVLSETAMRGIRGKGPYRNAYLSGTMPWHRSLRDVNLCTGNLFKSFTDLQVAPARGAGLVLQRTYNSNDERIGPFGVGWTHAYDIRIEEGGVDPQTGEDLVPRTDFFGGKHKYKRDADGLYSPPAYLFDELDSNYATFLVDGPAEVLDDTQRGMDGTVKFFTSGGTDADGTPSAVRVCSYIEDRHGNRTTFSYDLSYSLPGGGTKKLLTQVTDPSGRSLSFTWNNFGTISAPAYRITQVQGPLYRVTYGYNSELNLSSVTLDPDGVNRTTTFGYTSFSDTGGTETGLLSSITDPLGHSVSYQYGFADIHVTGTLWVRQISEPSTGGAHVWTLEQGWDSVGSVFHSVGKSNTGLFFDLEAQVQQYRKLSLDYMGDDNYGTDYDSANNVTVLSRAARLDFTPETSGFSTLIATYGPHGNVLTQRIHGLPGQTTYNYFNASKYFQKESVTDPMGRVTRFEYFDKFDANVGRRGNVAWVRDARHGVTGRQFSYAYNANGQKISETNLNNVVTNFTYGDAWGNLTQVVQDPGGLNRTTSMVYDVAGRVTSSTDPMGRTSNFGYNSLGQPLSASFPATANTPAETISYGYGLNGRTESVTDGRGTTRLAYETGNDRLASVTDPTTGTTSYTYTLAGQRSSMTLPGGGTWNYGYGGQIIPQDDPNSVSLGLGHVSDEAGRRVEYVFDSMGLLREAKSNQTFDAGGNLRSYMHTLYELDRHPTTNASRLNVARVRHHWHYVTNFGWANSPVLQNDYSYDEVTGQRTGYTVTDANGATRTESYGYDELSRLTSVNYGDGQTQGYSFDAMGNRLSKTDSASGTESYGYNNANMLLSRGGNSYTNDANGNTLTGGGRTNTWDSQNRLVQCVNGSTTSSFVYGADGLRRQMTTGGVTTNYALDGQSVVREFRGGTSHATYFQGARGPEYRRNDSTGQVRWYLYDGLGSVQGEVDEAGTVTASRKFDVYGLVRGSTGTSTSQHKFVGQLGHTSEDETGLIYMRARYYDPSTGRFASEDSMRDGRNWFVYCGNNPINKVDSSGNMADFANDIGYFLRYAYSLYMGRSHEPVADVIRHLYDIIHELRGLRNVAAAQGAADIAEAEAMAQAQGMLGGGEAHFRMQVADMEMSVGVGKLGASAAANIAIHAVQLMIESLL